MKTRTVLSIAVLAALAALRTNAVDVTPFDELRAALVSAADGATVTLADGTYAADGTIEVTAANVTLRSANGKGNAVIEGDTTFRLLKVSGENFTVSGITFKKGGSEQGGAIKVERATPVSTVKIVDCDFVECTAKLGGAIFAHDDVHEDYGPRSAYGLVSGCTFTRCASEWTDMWNAGGAIYGSLWVEDSVFDACDVSANASRGQTSIAATSHMTVTNCVFKGQTLRSNVRGLVGTTFNIRNEDCPHGAVRLLGCTIAGNELASSSAGLFFGRVVIDRCVVSNTTTTINTEAETGGNLPSLYQSPDRSASRITSSLFVDNQCPFKMGSVPAVVNCTFVRNVGGLAYHHEDSAMPVITNCVFWGNIEKTKWPWNRKYKGVPGFYWYEGSSLGDSIRLAATVIEGGSANADVVAILATDASGASARITALADQKGPGFKNMATGDWSLKKASVLVDGGVLYDGIASARDLAGHPRCLRFGAVDPEALPDLGGYEFYSIPGLTIRLR